MQAELLQDLPVWDEPAGAFVFKALTQLLHRGRIGKQIKRFQKTFKISCIHEHDSRLAVFFHDDWLFGIAHRQFRQFGGAVMQVCGGYSFHGTDSHVKESAQSYAIIMAYKLEWFKRMNHFCNRIASKQ